MATSRKRKRLSDAYRFDGFRPLEELDGVFGDPFARVITLVRPSKKALQGVRANVTCLGGIDAVKSGADVHWPVWTSLT
jgi:hypothetical protein